MKQLVSTNWLQENINKVKIFDASWHLPASNRNAIGEFENCCIKNSIFFDIDKNSDNSSSLPHMLSTKKAWEETLSSYGIKNSDHVIIYDNSNLISSCRVWYNFLYFNHDPNYVSVLDGGLKKWLIEKKPTFRGKSIKKFSYSNYKSKENNFMVLSKDEINENIKNKTFELVDARSKDRFLGLVAESRKELRSGNIKGSKNLPFTELINDNKTFKKKSELSYVFKKNKINLDKNLAFTCGSGITACILGLANSIINDKKPVIYDGSWAEYGIK